jgi:hypothetical protein
LRVIVRDVCRAGHIFVSEVMPLDKVNKYLYNKLGKSIIILNILIIKEVGV